MVAKKSVVHSIRKSKCLKTLGTIKPSMGDGLIYGAVIGFLLGLVVGINKKKSGEDLGTFALESGIRGSIACAFLFGLVYALRMFIKV